MKPHRECDGFRRSPCRAAVFTVVCAMLPLPPGGVSAAPGPIAQGGTARPEMLQASAPEPAEPYIISYGDTLAISVYRRSELNPALSLSGVVGPDGVISLPLAGDIHAEGMTRSQLRAEIGRALSNYFVSAEINVAVAGATGQKVYVLGEVNSPGTYIVSGSTTALEMLLMAGGFTRDAHTSKVILVRTAPRPAGASTDGDLTRLNLKQLVEKADVRQNITLRRGDILLVPPRRLAKTSRLFGYVGGVIQPFLSIVEVVSTIVILRNAANQ